MDRHRAHLKGDSNEPASQDATKYLSVVLEEDHPSSQGMAFRIKSHASPQDDADSRLRIKSSSPSAAEEAADLAIQIKSEENNPRLCDPRYINLEDIQPPEQGVPYVEYDPKRILIQCPICLKRYAGKGNLVKHIRVHTGEKPFSCPVCGKGFKQNRIKEHLRTHTGEKPYECPICKKRFKENGHLTKHTLVHTGEKPYVCPICGKGCNQNHRLIEHMRTHTGERPFKCPVCDKGFSLKSHMQKHMLTHRAEKPHECQVCGKRYAMKKFFKNHIHCHENGKLGAVVGSYTPEDHKVAQVKVNSQGQEKIMVDKSTDMCGMDMTDCDLPLAATKSREASRMNIADKGTDMTEALNMSSANSSEKNAEVSITYMPGKVSYSSDNHNTSSKDAHMSVMYMPTKSTTSHTSDSHMADSQGSGRNMDISGSYMQGKGMHVLTEAQMPAAHSSSKSATDMSVAYIPGKFTHMLDTHMFEKDGMYVPAKVLEPHMSGKDIHMSGMYMPGKGMHVPGGMHMSTSHMFGGKGAHMSNSGLDVYGEGILLCAKQDMNN